MGNKEIEGAQRRLSDHVGDGQGRAMIARRQFDVMGDKAIDRFPDMREPAAGDVDCEPARTSH